MTGVTRRGMGNQRIEALLEFLGALVRLGYVATTMIVPRLPAWPLTKSSSSQESLRKLTRTSVGEAFGASGKLSIGWRLKSLELGTLLTQSDSSKRLQRMWVVGASKMGKC